MINIFAPSSSDVEYAQQLGKELTIRNTSDNAREFYQLLSSSKEISRKDLLPMLEKLKQFMNNGHVNDTYGHFRMLCELNTNYFYASDLSDILSALCMQYKYGPFSSSTYILGLCARTVHNKDDYQNLVKQPDDLIQFLNIMHDQFVIKMILKAAKFDSNFRVPLVFNGFLDHTIHSRDSDSLELISLLVDNTQTRKYFIQMKYLPIIISTLYESGISDDCTSVILSLLDNTDLVNYLEIQNELFSTTFPKQIISHVNDPSSSVNEKLNSLKILRNLFYYKKLDSLPFNLKQWSIQCAINDECKYEFMHLLEEISYANPELFNSIEFDKEKTDIEVRLLLSYIAYECGGIRIIDLENLDVKLPLLFVCCSQQKILNKTAEITAQDPSNPTLQTLAAVNCLCAGSQLDRALLLQHAMRSVEGFVPLRFSEWMKASFGPSRIASVLSGGRKLSIQTSPVFDCSPGSAAEAVAAMGRSAAAVAAESTALRTKHASLQREFGEATAELARVEVLLSQATARLAAKE